MISYEPSRSQFSEVRNIARWVADFPRSPAQRNKIFESDAEIWSDDEGQLWAASIDSISEEYRWGLFRDPETLGWMAVTASLSDIAAVGAQPFGVMMGLVSPSSWKENEHHRLWQGVNQCLKKHETFLLGGDRSESEDFILSCLALGQIHKPQPLSRRGAKPGDLLFATGSFGLGNAVAMANFLIAKKSPEFAEKVEKNYRPTARLDAAKRLQPWMTSVIDSSDGLLAAVDLLLEINSVGAKIRWDDSLFHPEARRVAQAAGLPAALLATINNGEFELIFTAEEKNRDRILETLQEIGCHPLELGQITESRSLVLSPDDRVISLEPIRNLLSDGISPDVYLQRQLEFVTKQDLSC